MTLRNTHIHIHTHTKSTNNRKLSATNYEGDITPQLQTQPVSVHYKKFRLLLHMVSRLPMVHNNSGQQTFRSMVETIYICMYVWDAHLVILIIHPYVSQQEAHHAPWLSKTLQTDGGGTIGGRGRRQLHCCVFIKCKSIHYHSNHIIGRVPKCSLAQEFHSITIQYKFIHASTKLSINRSNHTHITRHDTKRFKQTVWAQHW
jgi:hypothetical protein